MAVKWRGSAEEQRQQQEQQRQEQQSYFDSLRLELYMAKWGMREVLNPMLHSSQVRGAAAGARARACGAGCRAGPLPPAPGDAGALASPAAGRTHQLRPAAAAQVSELPATYPTPRDFAARARLLVADEARAQLQSHAEQLRFSSFSPITITKVQLPDDPEGLASLVFVGSGGQGAEAGEGGTQGGSRRLCGAAAAAAARAAALACVWELHVRLTQQRATMRRPLPAARRLPGLPLLGARPGDVLLLSSLRAEQLADLERSDALYALAVVSERGSEALAFLHPESPEHAELARGNAAWFAAPLDNVGAACLPACLPACL